MCNLCNPQVAFTPPTTVCSRLFHLIEVSLAAAKNFRSIIFTSSQALLPNWDLFCPKHIRRVPHWANSPARCLWSSPPLSQRCEPTVHFDPNFKFLHLATAWPHKWCWNATNTSQSVSEEAKSVNYMLRSCSHNCFWPVFLQVLDFFFSNSFFAKGINVRDSPISVCCICINLSVYICVFVFDSSDGSGEGRSQLVCPHGTAAGSTRPTQSQSGRGTIYPIHIHTEISVNNLRRGCRSR